MKTYLRVIIIVAGLLHLGLVQSAASDKVLSHSPGKFLLPETDSQEPILLARRMGGMGCNGGGHRNDENCTHQGMQHRRGMGHGRMHGMGRGPGIEGDVQCPQARSTSKAPEEYYSKINPLKNTAENIEKGRLLFTLDAQPTCTVCHGSGNGLGMMSSGLNPPPRNFICKETMQSIPDGQIFWVIKNGSPGTGMPAFSDLNEEQAWQLVHYIRQLSK